MATTIVEPYQSLRFGQVLVKVTKANERSVEKVRVGKRRSPTRGPGTIQGMPSA